MVTDTQKQAINRAKEQAVREKVEVVIHGRDNKISDNYGRDPNPPKDKKHCGGHPRLSPLTPGFDSDIPDR